MECAGLCPLQLFPRHVWPQMNGILNPGRARGVAVSDDVPAWGAATATGVATATAAATLNAAITRWIRLRMVLPLSSGDPAIEGGADTNRIHEGRAVRVRSSPWAWR
ncbi:hypothetical protein GCM10010400_58690 [Streptomyces aculeolatus]